MEINSIEMTLTLPQNRKGKIVQQCQDLLGRSPASIRELSQKLVALHTAITVNNSFDYFLKRLGAFCQGHRTRGSQTLLESKMSDVFGLKAAKFAILTITQTHPPAQSIHLQLDNVVALSSLVKMGGGVYPQQSSLDISKEIWN